MNASTQMINQTLNHHVTLNEVKGLSEEILRFAQNNNNTIPIDLSTGST